MYYRTYVIVTVTLTQHDVTINGVTLDTEIETSKGVFEVSIKPVL